MNKDKMIPIDFCRKITPVVIGDVFLNVAYGTAEHYREKEFAVTQDNVVNLNNPDRDYPHLLIVSFAPRTNTGKQPVGDDVRLDITFEDGDIFSNTLPTWSDWDLDRNMYIESWKLNHNALLKRYKSEQGANMNNYTDKAMEEVTHFAVNKKGDVNFYNCNRMPVPCLVRGDDWFDLEFLPHLDVLQISRPAGEREEDHTVDGVTKKALTYKLDLLSTLATHYNTKNKCFFIKTEGEFALVMYIHSNEWEASEVTTNAELDGDEFWKLERDLKMPVTVPACSSEYYQSGSEVVNTDLHTNRQDWDIQPPLQIGDTITANDGAVMKKTGDNTFLCIKSGDKPVFTQAMADAGEKIQVGMVFMSVDDDGEEEETLSESIVLNISETQDGSEVITFECDHGLTIGCSWLNESFVKPIDNRTEEEKLYDAIAEATELRCRDGMRGVVSRLMASDKFTITRNK